MKCFCACLDALHPVFFAHLGPGNSSSLDPQPCVWVAPANGASPASARCCRYSASYARDSI